MGHSYGMVGSEVRSSPHSAQQSHRQVRFRPVPSDPSTSWHGHCRGSRVEESVAICWSEGRVYKHHWHFQDPWQLRKGCHDGVEYDVCLFNSSSMESNNIH